jgi:DegV family protein with EDD domain
MTRILVMTDSTCDLPRPWLERYDIRVVPTYVHFGLESLADDGVQLTRAEFYQRLVARDEAVATSAPPVGQVLEVMSKALAEADHVIAITAPARLSGIFNTFRLAAEQTDPHRVTLIDSGTLSMGLGWLVLLAAEGAAAGLSPVAIAETVHQTLPRVEVWAALDTFEYLRRSGRIGWARAAVGALFQLKPIIRLYDGVVSSVTRARTAQRAFATLVELVRAAAPLDRLAVMHSNYPEGGERLAQALADLVPDADIPVVDATPVIGVHVGPHGLGAAVIRSVR